LLVHGIDGMDEVSVVGPTTVIEVVSGEVGERYLVEPGDFGLGTWMIEDLAGGDPAENAEITRKVLGGMHGGPRDAVLANAAAALYAAGIVDSLREGVLRAVDSIDSGVAIDVLEHMIIVTNDCVGDPR
jgi:anthranilate phosphoribosyltransferase